MADKYVMGKKGERRMKDVEVCLPICVGTVSFWLGKKADEYHSHKWTVYVRSPVNEDLSPLVKKVRREEKVKREFRLCLYPIACLILRAWNKLTSLCSMELHTSLSLSVCLFFYKGCVPSASQFC